MAISRAQYEKKNRYSGQIRNSYDYWRTNGKHLHSRQVAVLIIAQVGRKSRMIWHSCFNLLTPIHLHVPFSSTFPCVPFFFLFHHSFNRCKLITNCEIDTYVEKWLLFDTKHIYQLEIVQFRLPVLTKSQQRNELILKQCYASLLDTMEYGWLKWEQDDLSMHAERDKTEQKRTSRKEMNPHRDENSFSTRNHVRDSIVESIRFSIRRVTIRFSTFFSFLFFFCFLMHNPHQYCYSLL